MVGLGGSYFSKQSSRPNGKSGGFLLFKAEQSSEW